MGTLRAIFCLLLLVYILDSAYVPLSAYRQRLHQDIRAQMIQRNSIPLDSIRPQSEWKPVMSQPLLSRSKKDSSIWAKLSGWFSSMPVNKVVQWSLG